MDLATSKHHFRCGHDVGRLAGNLLSYGHGPAGKAAGFILIPAR
jgi:hypothetical protein